VAVGLMGVGLMAVGQVSATPNLDEDIQRQIIGIIKYAFAVHSIPKLICNFIEIKVRERDAHYHSVTFYLIGE
jgi:hypothetical protein